jgi:hypothetical protein
MTVAGGRSSVAVGACRDSVPDQRPGDTPPRQLATGYRPLLITIALLFSAFAAGASPIPLQRYIESLEALRVATPDVQPAQARLLIGTEVDSPNGRFAADTSLLEAVSLKSPDAVARLDAELAALRQLVPVRPGETPDPRVIEALRREEAASALRSGGEVGSVPPGNEDAMKRWIDAIGKAFDWFLKKMEALGDWFRRWWPKTGEPGLEERRRSPSVPFLVTALVIVIVGILTVLALEVMRRSRPAERDAVMTSTLQASKGDEDPLSRGANEWERYAAQLVAAGRIREAIRAWYHAVLVTLYAAGILRFRKGRTNWEYVAALSPEFPWRSAFVQLTGRFEQEWYGRDESTIEALEECSGGARTILTIVRRGDAA